MRLVKGDELTKTTRETVLSAYVYRLTTENGYRPGAKSDRNPCGATVPAVSDAEWLQTHAFWVTDSGRLTLTRKHCEPAFMADGE